MPSVITILFRGVLVFHQIAGQGGIPAVEVGLLPEKGHYARVITHTSGSADTEKCLFPEPKKRQANCYYTEVPATQQPLKLLISNSVDTSIVFRTIPPDGNEEIDRLTHAAQDDFRWILDIESLKFHGKQDGNLDTSKLKVVMLIPSGTFYAAELSDPLTRHSTIKGDENFGRFAGLIGCEIKVAAGGNVKLVGADPSSPIFTFESSPGVTYEISNAPINPVTAPREDHFHLYYDLFIRKPFERFSFLDKISGKGPNPALCGIAYLSQSDNSFIPQTIMTRGTTRQSGARRKRSSAAGSNSKHRQH